MGVVLSNLLLCGRCLGECVSVCSRALECLCCSGYCAVLFGLCGSVGRGSCANDVRLFLCGA